MLKCDLPDSPLASYRPDTAADVDQLPDYLREKIAEYQGAIPASLAELRDTFFRILALAMKEANCQEVETRFRNPQSAIANPQSQEIVVKMLHLMSRDTDLHYRMRALCYLRLMGKEGRSFQKIADELGVVRATVHKCYRDLQKRLGNLPGRGDKSPEAREKYRRLRMGKRRERGLCRFGSAWQKAAQLPLPVFRLAA